MGTYTHSIPKGIHPVYDPGPLDGPPGRVLATIDRFIAQAAEWEATLLNLKDTLTKELKAHVASVGTGVPDAFYRDKQRSLDEALAQLHRGVSFDTGLIPLIARIAGKPGLDVVQQSLTALRQLRDTYQQQVTHAGNPNRTAVFRLTRGRHVHDGRLLRVGDTVTLTATQFAAFRDKFEPADAPPQHSTDAVMEKRAGRRRAH
jgi:hypothetical protein